MKEKLFTMRADEDLLNTFKAVCKDKDMTQAQVLRNFMREYINKNKQPDLFKSSKGGK